MMKSYRRLALIDTGAEGPAQLRDYAREFAAFFGIDFAEMAGSDALLRALVGQDHGEDFVVVEPGQALAADMFLTPIGTVNA